jgi:hypothetical protein
MRARLPSISRPRLVALGAAVALLAVVAIASASLGGGAKPPRRPPSPA